MTTGRDRWRLGPGARWQTPCPGLALAALPAPPPPSVARAERLRRLSPALPSSTLREQNDLFDAALAARRRGDTVRALRLLDELLLRYPDGALVDSARAERHELRAGPLP